MVAMTNMGNTEMKATFSDYLLLDFLFAYFVLCGYDLRFDFIQEDPGAACSAEGISNYLEFGWNNYFHWFWSKINNVCRFENMIFMRHNWLVISYYALLKFYGERQKLNVLNFRLVFGELFAYMILFLWDMSVQTNIVWTFGSLLNAIVGFVHFFYPLVLFATIMVFFKFVFIRTNLKNWWKRHPTIYDCAFFVLASALMFPVSVTLLICFFAAPVGGMYLYYTIPAILNDRVFGKSSELGVKRKSFLIFLAVLFFIIETYVLLSLFPEGTIFQNFLQIYVVNLCLHILFYGIVMAVRSPQKIRYLLSKMNMN